MPVPRHISRRHRYEPEAFEAYEYPAPQSKAKDYSRTYGQHRTRPKQSLHPKKATEYQDQEQEADEHIYHSDNDTAVCRASEKATHILNEYRKEPTASIRPQRVQRKDHSSKPGDAQGYIGSQSAGADKKPKGSSANPAGIDRKHTTNQSTRTPRPKPDSKRRPEKPGEQAEERTQPKPSSKHRPKILAEQGEERTLPKPDSKRRPERPAEQAEERTSTNTASRERAHTTSHSSSTNYSARPKKSQSEPKVTINEHEGSSLKINFDPNGRKIGISIPGKKSTGHRSKEKPKESSRASRHTKLTKETVPDYYAVIDSRIDATYETISKNIKKKQLAVHPDKRVTSEMSEQEIAEINKEAALVNRAAEVLKDAEQRGKYDQKWQYVYGHTVRR